MLPEKDRVRIMDMRDHTREALEFIKGKNRKDLDEIRMLNLSLVRLLEIVGEAAARVTESTKEAYPDIQWRPIAGLRNRLIHGYNQIDHDILWEIVHEDMPQLLSYLDKVLNENG